MSCLHIGKGVWEIPKQRNDLYPFFWSVLIPYISVYMEQYQVKHIDNK